MSPTFDIVIPTVGRAELARLLRALDAQDGPRPTRIFVVDDRVAPARPIAIESMLECDGWVRRCVRVVTRGTAYGVRGPAAARNRGWRRSRAEWVVFVDDDVTPDPDWLVMLAHDLRIAEAVPHAAGSSGQIYVPLHDDVRPTDWERDVAGLERAVWATADMAYRRTALEAVDGFDERFTLAYREDADLGLRITEAGYDIVPGARRVAHPAREAHAWVSVQRQRGNAFDARMRAKHGRNWRERAHAPKGRFPMHAVTVACAATAIAAVVARRPRVAALAALGWGAATGDFAWRRIAPGPRTMPEVAAMIATSVAIPPLAVMHRVRGEINERVRSRRPSRALALVLFDRDGTIVVDEPYNGDPRKVEPVPGARVALDRLRGRGIDVGVVSNQSGIARGLLTHAQVRAVNARVDELLGPFSGWWYCPHDDGAHCDCRKPAPGLLLRALRHFSVRPDRSAFIGDTVADVEAARAAGMRGVLVPNDATRREEVDTAPDVAPTLDAAVRMLIGAR